MAAIAFNPFTGTFDFVGGVPSTNAVLSKAGEFQATADVAAGLLVYVTPAGIVEVADNVSLATAPASAWVVALPSALIVTLAYFGRVDGFSGLTPGTTLYLGRAGRAVTAPLLSLPSGSIVQAIGTVLTPSSVLFQPQPLVEM
jgi:hypothetical protein